MLESKKVLPNLLLFFIFCFQTDYKVQKTIFAHLFVYQSASSPVDLSASLSVCVRESYQSVHLFITLSVGQSVQV